MAYCLLYSMQINHTKVALKYNTKSTENKYFSHNVYNYFLIKAISLLILKHKYAIIFGKGGGIYEYTNRKRTEKNSAFINVYSYRNNSSLSHGADSTDRQHASSDAPTRVPLRNDMRLAVRSCRGCCSAVASFAYFHNAPALSDSPRNGI